MANVLTRRPWTSPCLFAATSTYVMWSRPWIVLPKLSRRPSTHFTGRPPTSLLANITSAMSA